MSSEAENVVVSGQRPKEYVFVYPKAQDMFQRISSQLSADDFRRLQRETYILLGHPLREKEFYYDGIGSSGVKKGGAGGGEEDAAATTVEVKKTSFDLKLVGFDASAKIKVIKEIRSLCNLGLKEAKSLVESAPTICLKGLKTEEAEEAKKKLVEVGAEIELV
jgi:large subunit ribosomal protein L7/L12